MLLAKTTSRNFLTLLANLAKVPVESINVNYDPVDSYTEKSEQGKFTIMTDDKVIGIFTLVTMPGCCGVVVSTGASVSREFQGKGIGYLLNLMRKRIAFSWGYSLMLCTDVESNLAQQKILNRAGWTKHLSFRNERTGNQVAVHSISIRPYDIELGFTLP